jgi:hypothetical protein
MYFANIHSPHVYHSYTVQCVENKKRNLDLNTGNPFIRHKVAVSKAKQSSLTTYHEGTRRERRYRSYSFMTLALDVVGGQRHAPAALYPKGKDPRYPLDTRLGGPQSWYGHKG